MFKNPHQFERTHGMPGHDSSKCEHCSENVYWGMDLEGTPRSEVRAMSGFTGRTPEYLLQQHKERQARRSVRGK